MVLGISRDQPYINTPIPELTFYTAPMLVCQLLLVQIMHNDIRDDIIINLIKNLINIELCRCFEGTTTLMKVCIPPDYSIIVYLYELERVPTYDFIGIPQKIDWYTRFSLHRTAILCNFIYWRKPQPHNFLRWRSWRIDLDAFYCIHLWNSPENHTFIQMKS